MCYKSKDENNSLQMCLKLAYWSEIKFKKIVLMLDEIPKGVLFTLILAGNMVLNSQRGIMVGVENNFPLEKTVSTFGKINGQCACNEAFSVGKSKKRHWKL